MRKKKWLWLLLSLVAVGLVLGLAVLGIDFYVKAATRRQIVSSQEAAALEADCILILGCGVRADGSPSNMLSDRLCQGIALYEAGASEKLLMSGDHGREEYDEVNTMKTVAVAAGVPSEDVFMDHAGFSTYESLYRAKAIFGAQKIIIVSQKYHLYRALYIARKLGLEAVGVEADLRHYAGGFYRGVREILARNKDFWMGIFRPKPTYLGDAIPIGGDGNITNDRDIYTAGMSRRKRFADMNKL